LVHYQFQALLDESRDTPHDPIGCPRAAAKDHSRGAAVAPRQTARKGSPKGEVSGGGDRVKIIGVSSKGVPAFFQLSIKIVEEDVRQQWTQGSALRHSRASRGEFARGHHDSGSQVFSDQ